MNRLGIGIIGTGGVFEAHALAYAQLASRARLLAVADVDEPKLHLAAGRHRIPAAYADYHELLARADVDLVVVCTPPSSHAEIAIAALEAGKYVVCEKPLAPTLAAADRILAAARRFPGRLSTVHQFRYLPEVQRAVWLRDRGDLGALFFGRFSRYARYRRPAKAPTSGQPPKGARSTWWGDWEVAGGGVAMTQLIHELDLACHLFGPAAAVSATVDTLSEAIGSEDTCAAIVRFESGAIVSCYGTVAAQRTWSGFDVFGSLGSVHHPWAFECMDRARREETLPAVLAVHPLPPPASQPDPQSSAHTPYVAAVLDAIDEGRPLPIGPDEARTSVELCTAIYASALSGSHVALPLDRTHRHYTGITRADYEVRVRHGRGAARGREARGSSR